MSIDVHQKSELIFCLDKPSHIRTSDDLDVIYNCIKTIKAYSGLHPYLLQQMCLEVRYERLKDRIVVYQGGKPEKNCYVVMTGSLIVVDIDQLPDILNKNHLLYSKLFPVITEGCAFGNNFRVDSSNNRNPFSINLSDSKAVVTQEHCELLYMDQKVFQEIWSKNEKFFRDLNMSRDITAIENTLTNTSLEPCSSMALDDCETNNEQNLSVPVPVSAPGQNIAVVNSAYYVYKSCKPLLTSLPSNYSGKISGFPKQSNNLQAMVGEDMVSWMRQLIKINSRLLAIGIWQVLIEDNILNSITSPYILRDSSVDFYVFTDEFHQRSQGIGSLMGGTTTLGNSKSSLISNYPSFDDLDSSVNYLMKLAPDALFRMILHKPNKERTKDELEFIFGELLHIKALSHLSSMVKRQLAMVLMYEIHPYSGRVVFYQGSEGNSWYIIVKGSVDVHIKGKGVVCRLKANDDFGKLALVNNSPRAATILLREDDCHFLKIDKEDFNRILRNVEVNTVRLKEHGRDVLLFEKRATDSPGRKYGGASASNFSSVSSSVYSIMAGTPEKLIDHILEYSIDINKSYASILDRISTVSDPILETFILTYFCFLTSHGLCSLLLVYFQNYNDPVSIDGRATPIEDKEHDKLILLRKTRVVHFLYWWCRISDGAFFEDRAIQTFSENLLNLLSNDKKSPQQMNKEFLALSCLLEQFQKTELMATKKVSQRSRFNSKQNSQVANASGGKSGGSVSAASNSSNSQQLIDIPAIKGKDMTKFTVYFSSGSSCMLRLAVESTVETIIKTLAKHQNVSFENLCLVEIRNDGDKVYYEMEDVGSMYSPSVNSKLYLLTYDEQKELSMNPHHPLLNPQIPMNHLSPKKDSNSIFDSTSIDELAFHLTFLDWQLFKNIHVYELLYKVLGRPKFGKITSNLDTFIHQFTSVQLWTVTEVCSCQNLSKRVTVLKKMIKLANRLSELKNISSSFAVLMGLNNSAVTRLQITWDRLSNKHKKIFNELCSLMDPTRNHCAFRQYLKKTPAPIIPFVAIMLKDLTFINEANKTYFDEHMINFEKMQLFAGIMHQFLHCRIRPMIFENINSSKRDRLLNSVDLQFFVRNLKCAHNQKHLTQLSLGLESKTMTGTMPTSVKTAGAGNAVANVVTNATSSNINQHSTGGGGTNQTGHSLSVGFNTDNF